LSRGPESSIKKYFAQAYRNTPSINRPWISGAVGIHIVRAVVEGIICRGDRVLDIGCGYGTEAVFLALQGMKVAGMDIVHEALATAKTIAIAYRSPVMWVHGDALALPYESDAFDVITDQGCFHHLIPEQRQGYAEQVARVLRSGGLYMLRGFSDRMTPGSGPRRLSGREILETFLPWLECEELYRFRNLPTEKRPDQWHWWSLWEKKV
jgi:ubiquinone/menaquinone biosynthesis C-methylase UbiE